MNLNLKTIFAIILVSITISLLYNHFNPNGLSLIREQRNMLWEDESSLSAPSDSSDSYITENLTSNNADSIITIKPDNKIETFTEPKAIKIDFAYKLYLEGVTFIDARPVEEFTEGHIKGAINIPFYGSEKYEDVLNKISKDEIVVTYCSGEDCDLSILLGDELFEKGYKRVYVFFGGWTDWLKTGYPISK